MSKTALEQAHADLEDVEEVVEARGILAMLRDGASKLSKSIIGHDGVTMGKIDADGHDAVADESPNDEDDSDNDDNEDGKPAAGTPVLESDATIAAGRSKSRGGDKQQSGVAPIKKGIPPPPEYDTDDEAPKDAEATDENDADAAPPAAGEAPEGDEPPPDDEDEEQPPAMPLKKSATDTIDAGDIYNEFVGNSEFLEVVDATPVLKALTDVIAKGFAHLSAQSAALQARIDEQETTLVAMAEASVTVMKSLAVQNDAAPKADPSAGLLTTGVPAHHALKDATNGAISRKGVKLPAGSTLALPEGMTKMEFKSTVRKALADDDLVEKAISVRLLQRTDSEPIEDIWSSLPQAAREILVKAR